MIEQMAWQLWNMPSVDELYDDLLKDKSFIEQVKLINTRARGVLKDYLLLKIRAGIGQSIIKVYYKENGRGVTYDIRNFETYVKWAQKHYQPTVVINK